MMLIDVMFFATRQCAGGARIADARARRRFRALLPMFYAALFMRHADADYADVMIIDIIYFRYCCFLRHQRAGAAFRFSMPLDISRYAAAPYARAPPVAAHSFTPRHIPPCRA